nr:39S ribosomal protein L37, mitochondrial-like [Vulpes vulpes]
MTDLVSEACLQVKAFREDHLQRSTSIKGGIWNKQYNKELYHTQRRARVSRLCPKNCYEKTYVYDVEDNTGFQEGYPYPYPHTLYFLETANLRPHRFRPDQLRAKMILFAFGNALVQARRLYGNHTKVLEQPVVVQSVGTNGCVFQFLVLQLNTTDLASNDGVKNLVWVDSDQLLYQHFWCCPVIKKKVVVEPVGPTGFQPETFRKFLALYLHGAV